MSKKFNQQTSFEHIIKDLEQIINSLEKGELPLEQALNAFEQGVQLARQGQKTLQEAEQRVKILINDLNDKIDNLAPFTISEKEQL